MSGSGKKTGRLPVLNDGAAACGPAAPLLLALRLLGPIRKVAKWIRKLGKTSFKVLLKGGCGCLAMVLFLGFCGVLSLHAYLSEEAGMSPWPFWRCVLYAAFLGWALLFGPEVLAARLEKDLPWVASISLAKYTVP